MSGSALKREDISPQIIHMYESNPNPCHIRDSECRYVYVNPAMRDLLDLPDSFNISGERLSDIPHWSYVFADEFCRCDEMAMAQKAQMSLLVTCAFFRYNKIQPCVFNIGPFFESAGKVVGTIAEVKPCKFFSPLQYVDGESPITLTTHAPDRSFAERDLEIIFFTYHGLTSKETARRLGISHRTVENRLCTMYQKAGVHNIYQFREFCRDIDVDYYIPDKFLSQGIRLID